MLLMRLNTRTGEIEIKTQMVFSESAFRKRYLPFIIMAFFLSLVFEVISIWQVFAPPEAVFEHSATTTIWSSTWIFLLLANEGLFKGISLSWYLKKRKFARRSTVEIKPGELEYRYIASLMSRRALKMALEGSSLPDDEKAEYGLSFTYHIRKVVTLKKHWDGSLVVRGEMTCETMDDSHTAFYGGNENGYSKRIVTKCVIPAVFEDMAQIEATLRSMQIESCYQV